MVQKPYIIFLNECNTLLASNIWWYYHRLLNLDEGKHVVGFFSSHFFKNERKESNTPQMSVLMLDVNTTNSSVITESYSIKLSKEGTISFSFLSFNSKKLQNGVHKWLANDHGTGLKHM